MFGLQLKFLIYVKDYTIKVNCLPFFLKAKFGTRVEVPTQILIKRKVNSEDWRWQIPDLNYMKQLDKIPRLRSTAYLTITELVEVEILVIIVLPLKNE